MCDFFHRLFDKFFEKFVKPKRSGLENSRPFPIFCCFSPSSLGKFYENSGFATCRSFCTTLSGREAFRFLCSCVFSRGAVVFFLFFFFALFYLLQAGGATPEVQSPLFRFLPSLGTSELYAQSRLSRFSTLVSSGPQQDTEHIYLSQQEADLPPPPLEADPSPPLETGSAPAPRFALESDILDVLTFVASGGHLYTPNLGLLFKTTDHQAVKIDFTILRGSSFEVYQGDYQSGDFAFDVPTDDVVREVETIDPRETNPDFPADIAFRSDLEVPLTANVQVDYTRLGLSYRFTLEPESLYDSTWFFGVRFGMISSLAFLVEGRAGDVQVHSLTVDTEDEVLDEQVNNTNQDLAVDYANEYAGENFSDRGHKIKVDIDDLFYYGLETGYRGRLSDRVVLHTYLRVDVVPASAVSLNIQSDNEFLTSYLESDRGVDLTEDELQPDVSYYPIPSIGIGLSYLLK